MTVFSLLPFFRIFIPFVTGIIVGIYLDITVSVWLIVSIFFGATGLFLLKSLRKHKTLLIIFLDCFLFCYALILVEHSSIGNSQTHYRKFTSSDTISTFLADVREVPLAKEKSIKCELRILEVWQGKIRTKTKGEIIAYLRKSNRANTVHAGSTLLIKSKLADIAAPANPNNFDYRKYLHHKHIYQSVFVDSLLFEVVDAESQINPIWQAGLNIKMFIIQRLQNSNLSPTAYGICAALITGYDYDIEKSVVEAFAHSGTLHVLAVSGLHTGLIYLVLHYIFGFFDRKNKFKILRFVATTLFLWIFALVTGFSPPVLRAVIMFTLLGFGKLFYRSSYRNQLNILLVSAFLMLSYDPWQITNVGFLLSYFALFGLIYFQPRIAALYTPKNILVNSIWSSVSASFAATLSTLPITLLVFKQFPLWFFVCNIVVVPAIFIILLLAILLVIKLNVVAPIINFIVKIIVAFIGLFNAKDIGYIEGIHFEFSDAVFLSLLIITFSSAFQFRSYFSFRLSLIVLVLWQGFNLFVTYKLKEQKIITVYSVRKSTAISVKNKTKATVYYDDSLAYGFNIKPHLIAMNYPQLKFRRFNYVDAKVCRLLLLDSVGKFPLVDKSLIDVLILSNSFKLKEKDFEAFSNLKSVVLTGYNNKYSSSLALDLCRKFGIDFYATNESGAFQIKL